MSGAYPRVEFDIFHLDISRPDLRIDAPCVELTILHEVPKKLVENV